MMEQAARRVKELVRLTDVLTRYNLTPNRAGFLHCPFHSGDRDASFKIYPATDSWYCFGCGEGGDVIDFVAKMERCSFVDALKKLDADFHLGLSDSKESYRNYRKRLSEQRKKAKEQSEFKLELQSRIAQRRALWLNLRKLKVSNHEQAQQAAKLIGEIELLEEQIKQSEAFRAKNGFY